MESSIKDILIQIIILVLISIAASGFRSTLGSFSTGSAVRYFFEMLDSLSPSEDNSEVDIEPSNIASSTYINSSSSCIDPDSHEFYIVRNTVLRSSPTLSNTHAIRMLKEGDAIFIKSIDFNNCKFIRYDHGNKAGRVKAIKVKATYYDQFKNQCIEGYVSATNTWIQPISAGLPNISYCY